MAFLPRQLGTSLFLPVCLPHSSVGAAEFTGMNFHISLYQCFWKEEVTFAFLYVDTILTFSLVRTL